MPKSSQNHRPKQSLSMASCDASPAPTPASAGAGPTPGRPITMGQHMIDKGAEMLQSLKPVKQISQHVCTFALYSHDMSRQIETHHYVSRLNQDFLQCAVYNSDNSNGLLIDQIRTLGKPTNAGMVIKPELENLAKTYGKFWCTWQTDRGDKLPLGAPALMMSSQGVKLGKIYPELVQERDDKYNISTAALKESRVEIAEPEWINPQADYWKQHGKGFAIDIEQTEMKKRAPFP